MDENELREGCLADLPLTLVPYPVQTTDLQKYTYEKLNYAMIAGMERTPNGRLWISWFGGEDGPGAFMLIASSDDDGKTWSQPRAVLHRPRTPHGFTHHVLVGNLWTDPKGRLWWFHDRSLGYFDGRAGVWATVCENPDSDNPVWSMPTRIWHGAPLNKPVILKNGEWIMAVSLWTRGCIDSPVKEIFREYDDWRMVNLLVSTDEGKSWHWRGKVAATDRIFDEPMFVERDDGSLLMLIRTHYGIARTVSLDGGRTWSTPCASHIPHVSSRFFLRKLSSGKLLLVKHGGFIEEDRPRHRSHLMAWISDNGGENWQGGLLLDDRRAISYPDGFQAPDGRIYICYDYNRADDSELYMAVFTEEDVRAAKEVSGKSRLKQLVNKALG